MRIRLTKSCIVRGHPGAQVGDVLEVSAGDGVLLIGSGKAVMSDGALASDGFTTHNIMAREPEVENRDPAPPVVKPKRTKKIIP